MYQASFAHFLIPSNGHLLFSFPHSFQIQVTTKFSVYRALYLSTTFSLQPKFNGHIEYAMIISTLLWPSVAGLITFLKFLPAVRASYNPNADDNLSVYWGM